MPASTLIMFAIGGYAYSLAPNPWAWLTSREAAEQMAEEVRPRHSSRYLTPLCLGGDLARPLQHRRHRPGHRGWGRGPGGGGAQHGPLHQETQVPPAGDDSVPANLRVPTGMAAKC